MEQPKVYYTEEELIKWLICDLEEQKKEIAKGKNIDIKEVKYKELVLNFGNNKIKINENEKLLQGGNLTKYRNYLIRFNFILEEVLKYFNIKEQHIEKEKNGFPYLICPFKVNISHCIFEATIIHFNAIIFEETVSFINTTFCNEVNFFALKFIKSVYFDRVNFDCGKDISFYNILFKSKVDFSNLKWKNKLLFYDINSNLEFNLSTLNIIDTLEIIEFNKNKEDNSDSIINLDNISFENSKSLLSIKDITNTIENASLKYIYMDGRINFYNIKIKNINLKGTSIIGNFSDINCEYDNLSNWQTARILKHEEYKKSNSIKALEYHAEEIKLYKEYLSKDIKKKFNIGKLGDIFSIYLSSFYSNNGLNWIKSLVMTILITIIFFSIFYIPSIFNLNYIFNKDYLYKLVEYFIPTKYDSLIEYAKNSNVYTLKKICGIIVYFAGKIMFWYGSVQTVQSFRKFSKKE